MNRAIPHLEGHSPCWFSSPRKLVAARGPLGVPGPLCIGRKGDAIYFSSESCGLDSVGAEYIREVDPGEIVVVEDGQLGSIRDNCRDKNHLCIFEYIYFARPDSEIFGQFCPSGPAQRLRLLAQEHAVEADLVIGVPDSGLMRPWVTRRSPAFPTARAL